MNICISTSSYPKNSNAVYHQYIKDVISILHLNGHKVSILTQDKSGVKENFIQHADVVWFPWKMSKQEILASVSQNKLGNIFSIISLLFNGVKYSRKIASEKKIDLFICLWIVPSGLYVFLKNLFSKKTPYILWSLGSDVNNNKDNFFLRLMLRLIIRNSKAVFADGFDLCKTINKISGRDCQFLPTMHKIKVTDFSETIIPKTKDRFTFLYVGRLEYVKGIDVLIESFIILKEESHNLNFNCFIIGDGSMMDHLQELIKENGLNREIKLLGKITDDKKFAEYFAESDCVVIPSRSESIPIVLSEAVQFGKPLLVADTGDMATLVHKYNLGLVWRNGDPNDLAEQIKKFIAQPLRINIMDQKNISDVLLFENSNYKLLEALS